MFDGGGRWWAACGPTRLTQGCRRTAAWRCATRRCATFAEAAHQLAVKAAVKRRHCLPLRVALPITPCTALKAYTPHAGRVGWGTASRQHPQGYVAYHCRARAAAARRRCRQRRAQTKLEDGASSCAKSDVLRRSRRHSPVTSFPAVSRNSCRFHARCAEASCCFGGVLLLHICQETETAHLPQ